MQCRISDLNSPAWVSGIVAAMVVVTQDNLTLDHKLKALLEKCRNGTNTCSYFNLESIHESILILLYFPNPPSLLSSQFQVVGCEDPRRDDLQLQPISNLQQQQPGPQQWSGSSGSANYQSPDPRFLLANNLSSFQLQTNDCTGYSLTTSHHPVHYKLSFSLFTR